MRILLVLPAGDTYRVTSSTQRVPRREMLRFSILPLTTVAALTPAGHEVVLCDENVQALDVDADVDLVGVSFMTALAPRAYAIAEQFRRRGTPVVAGGFHPTLCPGETAEHFDAVVVGDAEELWPRVVGDAEAGRLRRVYRHVGPPDLTSTPVPRRDLTAATAHHYVTTAAVQTGRGCEHGCRYCSVSAFHERTRRSRPLEHVLTELRGIGRDFMFVDDNIIADPAYARRLFEAMATMGKRWVSQCSLKIADDPALLALARRAGCRGLFVGIETLSAHNLEAMGKSFNEARRYRERITAIHKAGIGIVAGVMVGMDGDDRGAFRRMLRFLQRLNIQAVQVNILTPLPGTPLHEQYRRDGRIVDDDWSHYDFRHVVIRPGAMTGRQLQAGADWLYSQFYRLDRILVRSLRALWVGGPVLAYLTWRLNMTYRYDNRREGIVGRDPSRPRHARWRMAGMVAALKRRHAATAGARTFSSRWPGFLSR